MTTISLWLQGIKSQKSFSHVVYRFLENITSNFSVLAPLTIAAICF